MPASRALRWLAILPLLLPPAALKAQPLPGDPAAGERLAQDWCGSCHPAAPGRASDAVLALRAIGARPGTTPASLRAALLASHAPMPPLGLSRAQMDDLIAFILSSP
ncbi:c-type cytochrome [Falsiroseomonas sp.]|uniref:c-type cytochrome n=1 Tax=Falsiroseomonas sp. TaxID=2870721 RepID=UPI003F6FE011